MPIAEAVLLLVALSYLLVQVLAARSQRVPEPSYQPPEMEASGVPPAQVPMDRDRPRVRPGPLAAGRPPRHEAPVRARSLQGARAVRDALRDHPNGLAQAVVLKAILDPPPSIRPPGS